MEGYNDIVAILMPEATPVESNYLYAKFGLTGIDGVHTLFHAANMEIAAEILVNQIKPNLSKDEGYFIIFPLSDYIDVTASNPHITTSFSVVHYGLYEYPKAQAIARTHTTKLLEMFREAQQRYIARLTVNNSSFDKWSDDNSVVQQYTANVTVSYVQPYLIAKC